MFLITSAGIPVYARGQGRVRARVSLQGIEAPAENPAPAAPVERDESAALDTIPVSRVDDFFADYRPAALAA
jgi:hypothetical protein